LSGIIALELPACRVLSNSGDAKIQAFRKGGALQKISITAYYDQPAVPVLKVFSHVGVPWGMPQSHRGAFDVAIMVENSHHLSGMLIQLTCTLYTWYI